MPHQTTLVCWYSPSLCELECSRLWIFPWLAPYQHSDLSFNVTSGSKAPRALYHSSRSLFQYTVSLPRSLHHNLQSSCLLGCCSLTSLPHENESCDFLRLAHHCTPRASTHWRRAVLKERRLHEWEKRVAKVLQPWITTCLKIMLTDVLWNTSSEVGVGFKYLNSYFNLNLPEGVPLYLACGSISFRNSHFNNVLMDI